MDRLTLDETRWLTKVLNGIPQSAHVPGSPIRATVRKVLDGAFQPHPPESKWSDHEESLRSICEGLDQDQTRELLEAVKRIWELNVVPTDD